MTAKLCPVEWLWGWVPGPTASPSPALFPVSSLAGLVRARSTSDLLVGKAFGSVLSPHSHPHPCPWRFNLPEVTLLICPSPGPTSQRPLPAEGMSPARPAPLHPLVPPFPLLRPPQPFLLAPGLRGVSPSASPFPSTGSCPRGQTRRWDGCSREAMPTAKTSCWLSLGPGFWVRAALGPTAWPPRLPHSLRGSCREQGVSSQGQTPLPQEGRCGP